MQICIRLGTTSTALGAQRALAGRPSAKSSKGDRHRAVKRDHLSRDVLESNWLCVKHAKQSRSFGEIYSTAPRSSEMISR